MILADHEILDAVNSGIIAIEPKPQPTQYSSTALDLRVGDDFQKWNSKLCNVSGVATIIELDKINMVDLQGYAEPLKIQPDGTVHIEPKDFVFVRTLEHVHLKLDSQLAARIEGRSTAARLGMCAHISAPTIHAGFRGKIVLEILNHGPFAIKLRPNLSRIAQLIFERVNQKPDNTIVTNYIDQQTPLG